MKKSWMYRIDDLDRALAYRVYRLARILNVSLARLLAGFDPRLSAEQYFAMFRIAAQEGCRQNDLVDPYLNDAPNVTRLVDTLAAKGLVERRGDPSDRRRYRLYLTDQGRRQWTLLAQRIETERQSLYAGIDEDEAAAFLKTLHRLEINSTGRESGEHKR